MTMFCRPGSGRPIESQVLRPITMGLPIVSALKRFRSFGRCQGNPPSRPIAPRSSVATRMETSGTRPPQRRRRAPFFLSSGVTSSIVPRHFGAPQRQA